MMNRQTGIIVLASISALLLGIGWGWQWLMSPTVLTILPREMNEQSRSATSPGEATESVESSLPQPPRPTRLSRLLQLVPGNASEESVVSSPSPSSSTSNETKFVPVAELGTTGAQGTNASDPNIQADQQRYQLKRLLPVETDNFIVDYNYYDYSFIVKIKSGSREQLDQWLGDQGFSAIPDDEFILTR